MPIPALVKVFVIFALILVLNRLRLHLSLCLFIGAGVLGIWMGLGPVRLMHSALYSVTRLQTISLILIVGLILVMSRLMKGSGHMDRLVERFTRLSRDGRTVGSVMSALIGLLPMPGGALFSAPMVDTSLCRYPVTGELKTVVNYWFRHIWEYWWPLYPGVVLAIALLEVDTWLYMSMMAPMTVVSVLAGVVFILRPMGGMKTDHPGGLSWSALKGFLWEVMPILIVVLMIMGMGALSIKIPGALSILIGLLASTIWVCAVNRIPFGEFRSSLWSRTIWPMLLLVLAVMVFQGILTDSRAAFQIRTELMAYQIPVILIVMIMPFLSGLTTGIAVGFVGISFPLIIPLFQTDHGFHYMSFAALAYTFGYMGMMLSPVHICLLVSKDYFKARLFASYRHLIIPATTVMATAAALFFATRAF